MDWQCLFTAEAICICLDDHGMGALESRCGKMGTSVEYIALETKRFGAGRVPGFPYDDIKSCVSVSMLTLEKIASSRNLITTTK